MNLILEYVPENLYRCSRSYAKVKQQMPLLEVKLYLYQCLRSLAYIHSMGICHRDIKPQNLLLDPARGILKLCDFGSAKILVKGEPNVSYICSRYYRAPELIFGATDYTTFIGTFNLNSLLMGQISGQRGVSWRNWFRGRPYSLATRVSINWSKSSRFWAHPQKNKYGP